MRWELEVKEDESGDRYIELNPEILEASGFVEGDTIKWIDNKDGSYTLMHAERMDGYTLTTETFMADTNRSAKVFESENDYVVDLWEGDEIIESIRIQNHSEVYVKDLVENWVMCYGEFSKK